VKKICLRWHTFILILFLVACQSVEVDAIINIEVIDQVENLETYLSANIGISAFGGEVFCAYEPLNAEQGEDGRIFLWAMCLEYYLEDGQLTLGSGISVPVALQIRPMDEHYQIITHLLPRDGTFYGQDVRASFPQSTWRQIMPESVDEIKAYNARAERLELDTEEMARVHFNP